MAQTNTSAVSLVRVESTIALECLRGPTLVVLNELFSAVQVTLRLSYAAHSNKSYIRLATHSSDQFSRFQYLCCKPNHLWKYDVQDLRQNSTDEKHRKHGMENRKTDCLSRLQEYVFS